MPTEYPLALLSSILHVWHIDLHLQQAQHIGLCHLLEGEEGSGLEVQVASFLCHLLYPLCKEQFTDQELCGFLRPPDLPEGQIARLKSPLPFF